MAHHYTQTPSEKNMEALKMLLERKLRGVPHHVRGDISVEIILANTLPGNHPFERSGHEVADRATLAGILFYSGSIRDSIRCGHPFTQWNPNAILAYFMSDVDIDKSFNTFYRHTRVRLYRACLKRLAGTENALQRYYILACLETRGHTELMRPGRPTYWREQEYCEGVNVLQILLGTKDVRPLKKKPRNRKNDARKGLSGGSTAGSSNDAPESIAELFEAPLPETQQINTKLESALYVNTAYIDDMASENPLLNGLLWSFPGLHLRHRIDPDEEDDEDEEVEVDDLTVAVETVDITEQEEKGMDILAGEYLSRLHLLSVSALQREEDEEMHEEEEDTEMQM
ncbi:hypothetical protein M011DRAFT_476436 [Sporormia fimetaria CBS 119925]|uniref:Uncharacterized protein n=1 Tax=Sporormia fimetaria CBS 119925 TaxID=1340428 RepID=A0A6A6VF59_9PLEO|nr:hypothetical protein M011DRAFT_476436 [Sporormia fimetaria CBS 119925]